MGYMFLKFVKQTVMAYASIGQGFRINSISMKVLLGFTCGKRVKMHTSQSPWYMWVMWLNWPGFPKHQSRVAAKCPHYYHIINIEHNPVWSCFWTTYFLHLCFRIIHGHSHVLNRWCLLFHTVIIGYLDYKCSIITNFSNNSSSYYCSRYSETTELKIYQCYHTCCH